MITLYGPARSSAGRCLWCLEEAGVPYENKNVDMRTKEHKSPAFLGINPNGKVPALVDGNVKLFESMAINFYIADKYKPELLGTSPEERALSYQWSFWASSEVQDPIIQIFIQKMFMPDEKRSQAVIDENMEKLPVYFKVLNDALENKAFLNGRTFSLADLNTTTVISIAPMLGINLTEYKNIDSWLKGLSDRPAFQKYTELRKS
ncbi:MAG: glutathione S-transferase family protein [Bacteriovoracaceae bacterium]|nr:glutathione S-transferase family protein [Bacteriovoracaceae bacterium]